MKRVLADSHYWVAIVKPGDPYAELAKKAKESIGAVMLVTTDEILTEFLAALSKGGPTLRTKAAEMVRAILANPNVKVLPQSRNSFLKGLERYAKRQDKDYSLTDCVSMNAMETEGIAEVLTNDHHFEQEGFAILIKRELP